MNREEYAELVAEVAPRQAPSYADFKVYCRTSGWEHPTYDFALGTLRAMIGGVPAERVHLYGPYHYRNRGRLGRRRVARVVLEHTGRFWTYNRSRYVGPGLTRLVGRLKPPLAGVMTSLIHESTWTHVRDVDWDLVRRTFAAVRDDRTGRMVVAWQPDAIDIVDAARRFAARRFDTIDATIAWLCPTYPHTASSWARLVVRGVKPVDVARRAGAELSRREAHAWLLSGQFDPVYWLSATVAGGHARSVSTARWIDAIIRRGDWPVVTATRTGRAPDGRVCTYTLLDYIDEIMDCDLVRGPATGVRAAFAAARSRRAITNTDDDTVVSTLPAGVELPAGARLLNTPAAMAREGDEMSHCVGSYVPAVRAGQCWIVALESDGARATMEVGPGGVVRQLCGPKNAHVRGGTALRALADRIARAFASRHRNSTPARPAAARP